MATKKYKAPAGMNPEDAKDWEKHGTFVHHDPGGGRLLGADGKPLDLSKYLPKPKQKKTPAKGKTASVKKAK